MISTGVRKPVFHTSTGAATAGVLFALGIRILVADLTNPLAAGLVRVANSLIRWQHLHVFPMAAPQFLWSLQVLHLAGVLMILVIALRIAFWISKREPSSNGGNSAR